MKYRYCGVVDANYDADAIAALFTEDGVWDGGDLGHYSGRDAIHKSFMEPNFSVLWMGHYAANPIIVVAGDRARCQWYLWLPKISKDEKSKTFQGGTYIDQCRRIDGHWLFEHMQVRLSKLP